MPRVISKTKKLKSPWLGVLLNILGLGYIYSGNWRRFFLFWFINFVVVAGVELLFSESYTWAPRIIVLLSMIDVYNLIQKYNKQITAI